jgi:nitrile hydratase subunit beta
MNGPQDLGGQMGHGAVTREGDEPIFHAEWEKRAMAMVVAMGPTGFWNLDAMRHARESLPPVIYLGVSYYEIWMRALANIVVANDLASPQELAAGRSAGPGRAARRVLAAGDVAEVLARGSPYDRPCDRRPLYKPGDRVRCRNDHVAAHTRLPRYARGAAGEIVENHGAFVFPDTNAHMQGENPTWCYAVRFRAVDLWGKGADPESEVMIDLWEPYLERGQA